MPRVNALNQIQVIAMLDILRKNTCLVQAEKPLTVGERNAMAFLIGINTGLRYSDLCKMSYNELAKGYIMQKKTKRIVYLYLPDGFLQMVEAYCKRCKVSVNQPILSSVHGILSMSTFFRAIQKAGEELGLKLGTHTMRKTRGRSLYDSGVRLEEISIILGHTTTAETLKYIGITSEGVQKSINSVGLIGVL